IYNTGDFIYYKENSIQLGRIRAIVLANEMLKLKIQKIIKFVNFQKIFKAATVKLVLNQKSVTISSNNKEQYSYYINEIIYKFKDHWKIRNILLKYQHPSKYATVSLLPSENIPVLKLFLDLYYDDFGTYRNVYHLLGGVYIQFGNMPIFLRQQLRNHFVLGFVPLSGSFDKFIRPFIMEIKSLESGQIINIQNQEYWVIASFGIVTADLPQENDLASIKRHSANKGYQTCQVSKEHFTNNDLDFKNFIPILSQLIWNWHLQTPQDIYHATARKIMRLLKLTVNLFLLEGQKEFIETWHIKSAELTNIQQRINANRTDLVSKSLIKCWVLVAKSVQLVFIKSYSTDNYKNLQKCLETE
ncbi:13672_t:CDS:2, partial [Gigaspora margarita]